jgi:hypothetical protein
MPAEFLMINFNFLCRHALSANVSKYSMIKRYIFILTFLAFVSCQTKTDIEYVAKCQLLCDDEKGQFSDIEKLTKYRKWHPYDTVQKINQDSS